MERRGQGARGRRSAKRSTGELEAQTMETLWDLGGWRTPGQVHERLASDGSLAYTTVLTILTRLWRKGRLERRRHGRAYAYHPLETREQYTAARMRQLLTAAADRSAALGRFVEELGAEERAELRRMLGRRP